MAGLYTLRRLLLVNMSSTPVTGHVTTSAEDLLLAPGGGDNMTAAGGNATHPLGQDVTEEYDIQYRLALFLEQPHQIIALLLSLAAVIINILSLLALSQVQNRATAHFYLIISLALSDIVSGVSVSMYITNKVLNWSFYPRCMFMFIKGLNSTGLNISLLNLMGMALDHFMAIMRPLHYPGIMSRRRVLLMIALLWLIAVLSGFSDFLTVLRWLDRLDEFSTCQIVWRSKYQEEFLTIALAFICLIIMLFIYIKIYIKIHQRKMPGENVSARRQELKKNRRPLFTTMLILGTFMLCWLPMCVYQISLLIVVNVNPALLTDLQPILKNADQYLFNLLMLNCIADPIIYAVRMSEVKLGYKRLCMKCCCLGRLRKKPAASSEYSMDLQPGARGASSRLTSFTFQSMKKSSRGGSGGGGRPGSAINKSPENWSSVSMRLDETERMLKTIQTNNGRGGGGAESFKNNAQNNSCESF